MLDFTIYCRSFKNHYKSYKQAMQALHCTENTVLSFHIHISVKNQPNVASCDSEERWSLQPDIKIVLLASTVSQVSCINFDMSETSDLLYTSTLCKLELTIQSAN